MTVTLFLNLMSKLNMTAFSERVAWEAQGPNKIKIGLTGKGYKCEVCGEEIVGKEAFVYLSATGHSILICLKDECYQIVKLKE